MPIAPRTCRRGSRRSSGICATHGLGYAYHHALDLAAQARIWSLREAGLGLSMAMKEDAKSLSFVEDTAVAPERLRDYIERFLAIVKGHGTTAGVYAHASVGCLHVRPVINMKTEAGVRRFEAIANDISDLVLEFGGALSGEHGDGLVRSPFMAKMFGPEIYEAFRTIKRTFDPHGIFNPGKIVDAPPLTANLRFGPAYAARAVPTYFDYPEGSFAGAVEMCSGLGACRKTLEGTMCPSYMATRDEQHTTRGRANVLRLTIAGRLGEAGLGDKAVYDTLDLCLECRACKAECPVGVDVARFKSEFLADYWQRHGTPLHARALGNARAAAEWGSRLAPLSNWIVNSELGRRLNERLLGIDRRRAFRSSSGPRLRIVGGREPSTPFRTGTAARANVSSGEKHHVTPDVLLFNDTFTNHYDPEIGVAALYVLTAAGFITAAGTEPLLRASADLEGPVVERARNGRRATPTRCLPMQRPAGPSSSASRAACRRSARTRRHCCAARPGGKPKSSRRPACSSRSFSRREAAPEPQAGPEDHPAAWPLPSEVDGPARACEGTPRRAFRRRRSSIWTPAAAAWLARSATPASTTTSRGRSGSASSSPPCAKSPKARSWSRLGRPAVIRSPTSLARELSIPRCCSPA